MNLTEIRTLADNPNADPVVIERECVRALVLRPTEAEHAELLYLYAEAYSTLHQQEALRAANYASRADTLAKEAGLSFISIQAALLTISCLASGRLRTKEVFWHDVAKMRDELKKAARAGKLTQLEVNVLQGRLFGLEVNGKRLEQNNGFAAA